MNLIKELREAKHISMRQAAAEIGIPYTTYVNYEKGAREPNSEMLITLANYFDVSVDYLVGRTDKLTQKGHDLHGAFPYEPKHKIPVLGRVAAGLPLYAEENIEGYILTELNGGAEYFGLRIVGDSMNAARIQDGDVVIVRKQDAVENGEIAIVLVDDNDATVKKFMRTGNTVHLIPLSTNPKHQVQEYDLHDTRIKVLGKVVRVQFDM